MQLLFVLGLIEFTFHVGGGREVGRRAVAYARRQIVQIVGLTIPKKKKNRESDKMFNSGRCDRGGRV